MTLSKLVYRSLGFLINCHYVDLNEIHTKYFAYCLLPSIKKMIAINSNKKFVIYRKTLNRVKEASSCLFVFYTLAL